MGAFGNTQHRAPSSLARKTPRNTNHFEAPHPFELLRLSAAFGSRDGRAKAFAKCCKSRPATWVGDEGHCPPQWLESRGAGV